MTNYEYLLSDINNIKGIGNKTAKLFKKKNINIIIDLLWNLPRNNIDRTDVRKIKDLQIGKIHTINVKIKKYNFPRIRNLPNRVLCEDSSGKLDCIFFNSYEGYIKKILPLNSNVLISGKVNYYKNRYQITNPTNVSTNPENIKKVFSRYSLTDGISENKYNKVINEVLKKIPNLDEWLSERVAKRFNYISWKEAITEAHNPANVKKKGNFLDRLIFDEIFSTFLINSRIRKSIKKIKKIRKNFDQKQFELINNKLKFKLTLDQLKAISDINNDLKSDSKMFRLLQGDVGSGKTIVSLIACANVISDNFQSVIMAPTEILAKQHFQLALNLLDKKINIKLLTSKTNYSDRKNILDKLKSNEINLLIGTHSLFQEKIVYKNLGLIVIDEQHKFGVKQRKKLSDKGGLNCDILVMSATPIPRTMTMTIYGDMDTSIIKNKPKNRKEIKTLSKIETKISEIIEFAKKQIKNKNQIFWVCPLIEESKKIDHQSSIKRFEYLKNIFKNKVGLLHGQLEQNQKNEILNKFLRKKIDVLVSTTVIEVGIDFPNANLIVIENSNKFGLSQLHQLRGRVGRGNKDAFCILMYKSNLSKNAKKRIEILKSTNDGFKISEEDMKLRGYGDLLGFKQSGIKSFKIADPIINHDLFVIAENEIKQIEQESNNFKKYLPLLKMYDKADIINDLV